MGFGSSSREGFCEEELQMGKGKFPFSYTSPSSSSPHQKTQLARPHQIYDWLGNRYEPEEDNEEITVKATTADDSKHVIDDSDSTTPEMRSSSAIASGNNIELKEHMFDKVVTPSDVGKLNRLVIPKQHAEKYFPLDSSTDAKGLLLNFEDRNGKPWRFRYSYWNSSQSYVMTKGWSRFVKDKKLDAGDVVSFQRVVGEDVGKDRLFIDWKRRHDAPAAGDPVSFHPHQQHYFSNLHRSVPWSPLLIPPPQSTGSGMVYNPRAGTMGGTSVFYLRSAVAATAGPQMGMMEWQQQGGNEPIVFNSVPVVQGKAAAKRLRLFGVNMECPISSESEEEVENKASHVQKPPQFSSSSASQHPLQLRLYNGTPLVNKGKGSMSFDLDM